MYTTWNEKKSVFIPICTVCVEVYTYVCTYTHTTPQMCKTLQNVTWSSPGDEASGNLEIFPKLYTRSTFYFYNKKKTS